MKTQPDSGGRILLHGRKRGIRVYYDPAVASVDENGNPITAEGYYYTDENGNQVYYAPGRRRRRYGRNRG